MIKGITAEHNESRNCLDDCIAAIASWWGREYVLMFTDFWNFVYLYEDTDTPNILGNRIFLDNRNQFKNLEKYHGIQLNYHDTKTSTEVFEIAQKEFEEGKPLIIYLNSFWNPWDTNYQKIAFEHFCIFVGFENEGKTLICVDPFHSKNEAHLPIEDFIQGCGSCFTINKIDSYQKEVDWREIIKTSITKLNETYNSCNTFNLIRMFADKLAVHKTLSFEMENFQTFEQTPLSTQLWFILLSRFQYANVLKYLSENYSANCLLSASRKLETAGMLWTEVRSMLTKASLKSDCSKLLVRSSVKIKEIAALEEEISNDLIQSCPL